MDIIIQYILYYIISVNYWCLKVFGYLTKTVETRNKKQKAIHKMGCVDGSLVIFGYLTETKDKNVNL